MRYLAVFVGLIAGVVVLGAGPALARSGGFGMGGYAHGGGIGGVSPFTGMTGLPSYTGVGGTGMIGSHAAQYGPHVGGNVSGGGAGSLGYAGASMKGTATGGASRLHASPFLGAGTGGLGGASGM